LEVAKRTLYGEEKGGKDKKKQGGGGDKIDSKWRSSPWGRKKGLRGVGVNKKGSKTKTGSVKMGFGGKKVSLEPTWARAGDMKKKGGSKNKTQKKRKDSTNKNGRNREGSNGRLREAL